MHVCVHEALGEVKMHSYTYMRISMPPVETLRPPIREVSCFCVWHTVNDKAETFAVFMDFR